MYEFLITQYISNLTKNDIVKFALSHGIELKEDELNFIYYHVTNNWRTIIYGNPNTIFNEAKTKLSTLTYNKVITLYQYFKEKFQNYL